MTIVISGSVVPNEMMLNVTNFLDARSKASFSQVCDHFREIIHKTGLSISMLGFNLYLTDELVLSGQYKKALAYKNAEEVEVFKADIGDQWFAGLSGTGTIPDHLLKFAICNLSGKRTWSDAKIKKLCRIFNRDAKKQMPMGPLGPYSWGVFPLKLGVKLY